MSNPDNHSPLPVGAKRIAKSGNGRAYLQIKVTDAYGKSKWPYLHRKMMEEHLNRPLKNGEVVRFKPGVNPIGEFTVEDLYIEYRTPKRDYKRRAWLMRSIAQTKWLLDNYERELAKLDDGLGDV